MGTASDGQFRFSALPTFSSIRLFRLAPSITESDFAFEVFDYELHNAPAYTALSYRWGSDKQSRSFILNSKWKPIHENLWYFLDQLRLERDTRLYWTDGICINQEDVSERSRQVSMMADIYSQAHSVMIWLGPHPHIAHCLEVLGQFGQPDFLKGESDETRQMARTHAVHEILNLEYWRRAWIVQEVAIGKKVRLKSRASEFDYEEFVVLCPKSGLSLYGFQRTRVESAWALLRLIASYKSSSNVFNMEHWLSELEGLLCMDPRDRIYSLLGLLRFSRERDKIQHPMMVDYSKPVEAVFLECAFMLLASLPNRTDVSISHATIRPIYDLMSKSPARGLLSVQKYSLDPSVPLEHKVWIGRLIHEVISFQLGMAEVNDFLDFKASFKKNNRLSVEKKIAQEIAALAVNRGSLHNLHNPWPFPTISGTCSNSKLSAGFFQISDEELASIKELDPSPHVSLLSPSNRPRQLLVQILHKALSKERTPGNGMDYSLVPEDDHITVSLTGCLPFSVVLWVDVKAEWATDCSSSHRVLPQKADEANKSGLQDTKLDHWWFVARRSKKENGKWRVFPVLVPGTICSCSQRWATETG